MKNYSIPLVALVIVLSFLFGRSTVKKSTSLPRRDTVTVVHVDTVVMERAIPQTVFVDRVIKDTLFTTDTVKVEVLVPINNYIFSDSLYRAEISGYNVSLDRMEIFQKTTKKTVHIPFPVKNNKRWGLGISAGYAVTPKGFQPYFGVGIQYNIIYF